MRLLLLAPLLLTGCRPYSCLGGEADCVVVSPCEAVAFTCDDGYTEVRVVEAGDEVPGGPDALVAPGDVILGNDHVVAVIEALDHPHYIAPTGGGMIDLGTRGDDNDALRHHFVATGLLPGDAVRYTDLRVLEDGDVKAVQVRGVLDGFPEVAVATRYEVRPCEPGVRIRTEIVNGATDTFSWYLTDAWYWGGRESLAFTPAKASGFAHPSFGLTTIMDGFLDFPYMAAGARNEPSASYAEVACDEPQLSGFHAEEISTTGHYPAVVQPRDWLSFERFVAVTDGADVADAAGVALELRRQLWAEPYTVLSGTIEAVGGVLGQGLRAAVTVTDADGVPVTHVVPDADGHFSARVPADRDYSLSVESFGREVATATAEVAGEPVDVGTIVLPGVGEVTVDVTIDGVPDHALVFVLPSDDATDEATRGQMYGHFTECAPLIGNPHGDSPACNRVLVDGPTTVALPPGTYDFFASAGPFSTLAGMEDVTVSAETGQSVLLEIVTLAVQPAGTLSGDFHVHGAGSFDASINERDRVRAFLASRIEVLASTEHDTVSDYAASMDALGAHDRMRLIEGTESTGHVLFDLRDDSDFPRVVGHWNFWPVAYDPEGPWRGAAWDELAEPGLLMTHQADAGWDEDIGVVELNHPLGGLQFGRDYAWGDAAGFDLTKPLLEEYDGTGQSLFFHTPDGADFSNADYDVQEVMNGTSNGNYLQYRAFWFWLLDQGVVRAGVANSDSHDLTENVVGTPRTLVWTDSTVAAFDLATFDDDLKAGRAIGTNGPVLLAELDGHAPSVEAFAPADTTLRVTVTAAPWVPVDEVRVIVNGEVVETIGGLYAPQDPFGDGEIERLDTTVDLAPHLPADGDAWVVLEAGHALEPAEDFDCDGVPDTGDNDRDGTIDWHDVEGLTEEPEEDCWEVVGPLADPEEPERDTALWYYRAVVPGGWPLAFTNPLLLDLDGDGEFTGVK
ncbi:MAG: CehA/McbA family metallohydrolase [Myxococcota bacterium]